MTNKCNCVQIDIPARDTKTCIKYATYFKRKIGFQCYLQARKNDSGAKDKNIQQKFSPVKSWLLEDFLGLLLKP